MIYLQRFERVINKKESIYQLKKALHKVKPYLIKQVDVDLGMRYLQGVFTYKAEYKYKIERILNSVISNLINKNLYLSYSITNTKLHVYLKDILSYRKSPPEFLYHSTKEKYVKSILENGLELRESHNYNEAHVKHPPLIFAQGMLNYAWGSHTIKINTKGLNNKWWYDLNFESKFTLNYMTNEPIPPSHLELID